MDTPRAHRSDDLPDDNPNDSPTAQALRRLQDDGQWVILFGHQTRDALQATALRAIGASIAAATQHLLDEFRRHGHLVVCCLLLLATCVSNQAIPTAPLQPVSWLTTVLDPSLPLEPCCSLDS